MVIVEEINCMKEKEKEAKKILSMWDLEFPKYYFLEDLGNDNELHIVLKKRLYRRDIATVKIEGDIININFPDGKDLEWLRECFKKSKIKFKIVVGSYY